MRNKSQSFYLGGEKSPYRKAPRKSETTQGGGKSMENGYHLYSI
jgi:hypothetical protein